MIGFAAEAEGAVAGAELGAVVVEVTSTDTLAVGCEAGESAISSGAGSVTAEATAIADSVGLGFSGWRPPRLERAVCTPSVLGEVLYNSINSREGFFINVAA